MPALSKSEFSLAIASSPYLLTVAAWMASEGLLKTEADRVELEERVEI